MRTSVYSATGVTGLEGLLNDPAGAVHIRHSRHAREATDDSEYGPASESLLPTKQSVSVWSVLTRTTIPILVTSFAMAFLAGTSLLNLFCSMFLHLRIDAFFSGLVCYIPAVGVHLH